MRDLLLFVLTVFGPQHALARDRILFAGQSNMIGHTRDPIWSMSETLFDSFVQLTREHAQDAEWPLQEITSLYYYECLKKQAVGQISTSDCAASSEQVSQAVLDLHERGLIDESKLTSQVPNAYCTYAGDHSRNGSPAINPVLEPTPVAHNSSCGFTFGHEFMFARSMLERGFYNDDTDGGVIIDKVAVGGTEIYQHWYPDHGVYWPDIVKTIQSIPPEDEWVGFVWHQGSQESWNYNEDTSLTYLGNLTDLVHSVRALMCQANSNGTCPDEPATTLPVVILQVGFWPPEAKAVNVRAAQAAFVENDPLAELVVTSDLGRFFHFDALSFLVMGDRIAEKWSSFPSVLARKKIAQQKVSQPVFSSVLLSFLVVLLLGVSWVVGQKVFRLLFPERSLYQKVIVNADDDEPEIRMSRVYSDGTTDTVDTAASL